MYDNIKKLVNNEKNYKYIKNKYDDAFEIYEYKIEHEDLEKDIEEIRLKSIIDAANININFMSFIATILAAAITIVTGGLYVYLQEIKNYWLIAWVIVTYSIIAIVTLIAYYILKNKEMYKIINASICLSVLPNVKEKNKEYKLDKILENTEQLKKFHGIE